MARLAWVVLLLGSVTAGVAAAGGNQADVTLVYLCRPAGGPIVVDGKLDPVEWGGAVPVSGFRVSGSEALAPEQVVMRLLYDRQNLYLGIKCFESNMKKIKTSMNQKDGPFWLEDSIEFFVDANHDHETYWQFASTAMGVCYDNSQGDSLWNANWQAAAQQSEDAWTVEAAVPFSELKLSPPVPGALWGFNLCRERQAGGKLELCNWADVQRVFNTVSLFGHLYFADANWPPTEAAVVAAARDAGGKETIVYVEDGTWQVKAGQAPKLLTYRSLLSAQTQAVPFLEELRTAYQKKPNTILRDEFAGLEAALDRTKALIAGQAPIGAEAWAQAKLFLDGLPDKVETIYWRVKLALLNEEI